jgi:hypothetical protein
VTPLKNALTWVEPTLVALANPLDPDALLIVAVDVVAELHVTSAVTFLVDPSE